MGSDALTAGDVRHCWANVGGHIFSGWEPATAWGRGDKPTSWRALNSDNPQERRLPSNLAITWQRPAHAV